MHRLLERQLRRARIVPDSSLEALLALVEATYEETEIERRGQERANALLSAEVIELNTRIRAEAEARVRAILDAVGDGVVIADAEGRIDAFNTAAAAIFDRPAEAMIGLSFDALWPLGVTLPEKGETLALRPDGSRVTVRST